MIMHLLAGQAFLASLIAGALADNGMVMSMDQGMDMTMGNMLMYLHFTIGDNLWFLGWAPQKAGAMAGACIGLFMLAIAERWLVAMRGVMGDHWSTRFVLLLLYLTPFLSSYFAHAFDQTVPRLRSPTSSIVVPLQWRRRRLPKAQNRRRRVPQSLGAAGCCNTTFQHLFLHMTSPVVFSKSSSRASTLF